MKVLAQILRPIDARTVVVFVQEIGRIFANKISEPFDGGSANAVLHIFLTVDK